MTSAQVVETLVTTTANIPSQDYTHPDDQTSLLYTLQLLNKHNFLISCNYPVYMSVLLWLILYYFIYFQFNLLLFSGPDQSDQIYNYRGPAEGWHRS